MDDDFSKLPPGSFGGVSFAMIEATIDTGSAAAFHRFPHRPGQKVEYLGREPVSGSIVAAMYQSMRHRKLSKNVLWPDAVETLRERVQEQKSQKLVLPVFGELPKAYVRMSERYTATSRNGCIVTLQYAEDQGDAITKGGVSKAGARLEAAARSADNELALLGLKLKLMSELGAQFPDASDLLSTVTKLRSTLSQANANLARPFQQAAALVGAIDDLVSTASALSSPSNWRARDALLEVKDGVKQTIADAKASTTPVKLVVATVATNAAAIARDHGNTLGEVLRLNRLADPNDIEAGAAVLVYQRAA